MKRILAAAVLACIWATSAFAWSFGVCGDTRDDRNGVFPRILGAVERSDMEFLVHTGDLERVGGPAAWETFRAKTRGFTRPLYVTIGNHELHGATPEEFARFFGLPGPSYSFRHKDARFAVVNNGTGRLSDETLQWLERDLGAHPVGKDGIAHLVLVMHIPPRTDTIFPHGTARGYGDQSMRLLGILRRHGVKLVLCSHEHLHMVEDWNGIKVIVSGGGGSPLVPFQRYGFYRVDMEGARIRETFIPIR